MADTLAWVASDAHCDALGLRRQVATELARDGDEQPWNTEHLYRWGPAAAAPPEEDEEFEDEFDLAEDPLFPDVPSTTSTSGRTPNRRMRRKAAAKARKR